MARSRSASSREICLASVTEAALLSDSFLTIVSSLSPSSRASTPASAFTFFTSRGLAVKIKLVTDCASSLPVGIHNVSAPRGNHAAARPLFHAAGSQLFLPHDLQIDKPHANAKKEEKESAHQQNQPLSYGGSR